MSKSTTDAEPLRAAGVRHRLDGIRELSKVFGASLSLEQLLARLLETTTQLLDAERGTIFLATEDGTYLESFLSEGGSIEPIRLRIGDGIAGWVAKSGELVNLPDVYDDPRFNRDFDVRSGFRTTSMLCVPMPDHTGKTVGVIQLLNRRGGGFDSDDVQLLQTVAAHAGVNLENARLIQSLVARASDLASTKAELEERVRELDLLVEVEREASQSLDLDELLDRLLQRAMQLTDAEAGSLLLRSEESGDLYFRVARGEGNTIDALQHCSIPTGAGIVGWVAQHREAVTSDDPAHDTRHDPSIGERLGVPPRNLIAVPLLHAQADEDDCLGAIEVLNRRSGSFDDADRKILTLIAGQACKAIVIARARAERTQSDRLAAVGQMMSGVLHDLKTPMTIVSGYAQLMAGSDEPTSREGYADSILKQLDLMAGMAREVLAYARGETTLLVRRVFMNKFADEVRQQLEREFAGKDITLEIDTRYRGVADFDELKLYRLIHNLARNAAHAMEGHHGVFRVVIEAEGDELIMRFSDNGRGVSESMQKRLFLAFATEGKSDGTGLGLAIVKKIVDDHHGTIRYETSPGQGTTFHVHIPIGESGRAMAARTTAAH